MSSPVRRAVTPLVPLVQIRPLDLCAPDCEFVGPRPGIVTVRLAELDRLRDVERQYDALRAALACL